PTCCSTSWTEHCVDMAQTSCGKSCSPASVCTPWQPGETSAQCSDIDATLGVPCNGIIPVCNRGTTTAPAGIRIVRYPAGSGQVPSSAPNRVLSSCSPQPGTLACTTAERVNPGQCISVRACHGRTE